MHFQEKIRNRWPLYESRVEVPLASFLVDTPANAADLVPGELGRIKIHEFFDIDKQRRLVLSGDFISLSTLSYASWEEFYSLLDFVINSILEVYSPPYFTRIGLRYQNLIVKSDLDLEAVRWDELIKSSILGPLSTSDIPEKDILGSQVTLGCSLEVHNAKLNIRASLAQRSTDEKLGFLIDTDCFTDQNQELAFIRGILHDFNNESRNFFNWAIKPRLRDALHPVPVETE